MYMGVLLTYMSVPCVLGAHGGYQKVSHRLGVELQIVASCRVDTGNQTLGLLEEQPVLSC